MSIYSGFPTRKDETHYNSLLEKLILTLQSHILQLVDPLHIPPKISSIYSRTILKMRELEEHKYLKPKFSEFLEPIATLIGIPERLDIVFENNRYSSHNKRGSQTTFSQSKFHSKKGSNGVSIAERQDFKDPNRKSGQLWASKDKTPKADREFRTTKNTIKQNQDPFYSMHQRKILKMNHMYRRKNMNHQMSRNFRPATEPQTSAAVVQGQEKYFNNLGLLKQAQEQVMQGDKPGRIFRVTEQVCYTSDEP